MLSNLWVNWTEEIGSKIFDHIIKDEKHELLLLFGVLFLDLRKDFSD